MLSKEIFIKVIEDVKEKYDYQNELNTFYKSHGADGYIFQPDCAESVLLLLEYLFNDDEDHMISYFCYELDFGRSWKPGDVEDPNGQEIKMETPEDLYNFLVSTN